MTLDLVRGDIPDLFPLHAEVAVSVGPVGVLVIVLHWIGRLHISEFLGDTIISRQFILLLYPVPVR